MGAAPSTGEGADITAAGAEGVQVTWPCGQAGAGLATGAGWTEDIRTEPEAPPASSAGASNAAAGTEGVRTIWLCIKDGAACTTGAG